MDILHLWDGDYPWDIRVNKISESLANDGHVVHVACRNIKRQKRHELYNEYHVHRMYALPKYFWKLNEGISFPAFFNPLWIYHVYSTCKKNNCQLIIARDLPLALTAIWVARALKIPCILDMAECYPELLRCIWQFEDRALRNYLLRNPHLADIIEKSVIRQIDHVWVMIEESKERLVKMGIPSENIDIVSNTPVLSRFSSTPSPPATPKLHVIYAGLLNPSRGLDTTLHGIAEYVKTRTDIQLTIIGSGKAERALRELCEKLSLNEYVSFLGWVDNTKIPAIIAEADVGIVPHHKCSHWDTTIPNKLFDYMAASKPVIVSNAIPIARIVLKENIGLVYEDFNAKDLCCALAKMTDRSLRENFSVNGRQAVESKYNWKNEERALLESIRSVHQAYSNVTNK